jgi:hypothetical protein
MAGSLKSPVLLGARMKAVPWLLLLQTAMMIDRRRRALSSQERSRLARLLRQSRGRPGNLTEAERVELRVIATKLDLVGIGRELMPLARSTRGVNGGSGKAP